MKEGTKNACMYAMNRDKILVGISIQMNESGEINVAFPYKPVYVQEVKAINGHRWHPEGKYWSFPNTNGTLDKILEIPAGEEIYLDSALQGKLRVTPLSHCEAMPKQSLHNFEDLRKELLPGKYSHKRNICTCKQ